MAKFSPEKEAMLWEAYLKNPNRAAIAREFKVDPRALQRVIERKRKEQQQKQQLQTVDTAAPGTAAQVPSNTDHGKEALQSKPRVLSEGEETSKAFQGFEDNLSPGQVCCQCQLTAQRCKKLYEEYLDLKGMHVVVEISKATPDRFEKLLYIDKQFAFQKKNPEEFAEWIREVGECKSHAAQLAGMTQQKGALEMNIVELKSTVKELKSESLRLKKGIREDQEFSEHQLNIMSDNSDKIKEQKNESQKVLDELISNRNALQELKDGQGIKRLKEIAQQAVLECRGNWVHNWDIHVTAMNRAAGELDFYTEYCTLDRSLVIADKDTAKNELIMKWSALGQKYFQEAWSQHTDKIVSDTYKHYLSTSKQKESLA